MGNVKIVDFRGDSYFKQIMEELQEFVGEDLVTDLVLTYRRDYTKKEIEEGKADDGVGMTCRYWFGETSSIFCLGLWANMRHIIERYINGEDLIDGG